MKPRTSPRPPSDVPTASTPKKPSVVPDGSHVTLTALRAASAHPLVEQVDGGLLYGIVFGGTSNEFAYVAATSNPPPSGYKKDTEYWEINPDKLNFIGGSGTSLVISGQTPVALPPETGWQDFENAEACIWTGFTGNNDPFSGKGSLYKNNAGTLYLRVEVTLSPAAVTSLVWYQIIPETDTPALIDPAGVTLNFNNVASVTPASGYKAYYYSYPLS